MNQTKQPRRGRLKMNHLRTVILETKRLILRPFTYDDVNDVYYNWARNPKVTKYLTWTTHESLEMTRKVIASWIKQNENPQNYQWCIEYKGNHQAIGSIGVVSMKEDISAVEIGYCISEKYWYQGITAEAFHRIITFMFEEVDCNRIFAKYDVNNPNSGKVMEKTGLKYEGTLLGGGRNNTGICDITVYGITKKMYFDSKIYG